MRDPLTNCSENNNEEATDFTLLTLRGESFVCEKAYTSTSAQIPILISAFLDQLDDLAILGRSNVAAASASSVPTLLLAHPVPSCLLETLSAGRGWALCMSQVISGRLIYTKFAYSCVKSHFEKCNSLKMHLPDGNREKYNQVYKSLKEFSQNGENFCKQVTSILQQRANLEFNYAKGLQKQAIKLNKALQNTKKNCVASAWAWVSEGMKSAADLHQKLGKAIELEAVKPTYQVLSVHEKKRKSLDNEVEKTANLFISNWNQQIKAKKKLMESTKKHEALFHLIESSKQTMTDKEKQKLLNKLKKSTEKLTKEDENYYQKNMAGCSTRLKWENTLENCYQNILELEKERIKLLCNNLNQYTQHISVFGQTLTTCHMHIHGAISKIDVEKDIQALMEETAISSTENKSEFLLTDYFEEDPNNAMNKERQKSSIKSKLLRLQRDIEKASSDREGLRRMLKAYSNNSFSDPESQKSTAALMEETILKLDLMQANTYKLSSVLAELEQRPQPSHPCSNSIFKRKEKQQTHSYVRISRPFLMKRLQTVVRRASSGGQSNPSSSCAASGVAQPGNILCKALYSFQARQDDELDLEVGDIVTIHRKQEGWWFGSLNGKKGHFPAAYVQELPSDAGYTGMKQDSQHTASHTL